MAFDTGINPFSEDCWPGSSNGSTWCWWIMAHYREQIRKAVITAVTGLTTTGTRVKSSPVFNLADNMSPTLAVRARQSIPNYETGEMNQKVQWAVEIVVEGYAKTNTDLLDTLDDMASEVETAIYTNSALYALCNGYIEAGEQTFDIDTDGDVPLGKIEILYTIYYHAQEGAPDAKA